jgi:acyl dehydratase
MTSTVNPDRPVIQLTSPPGSLQTYRAAALQRGHGKDRVPEKVLRLDQVRPDVDHIASYVAVCGGRLGSALPVLYPHMLSFPLQMALLTDGGSPFPAMGLVHVANSVTQLQPVPAGAALDIEVEMGLPKPHRRGRTIDLLARVSVDGELLWHSSSTYLRRESAAKGADQAAGGAVPSAEPDAALVAAPGALWRLSGGLGRSYAEVSGDRNPIHMSAITARLFGFKTAIAHGMWTAARCLSSLEGRLPDALVDDVEFRAPIQLPGTVEFVDDGAGPTAEQIAYLVKGRKDRLHLIGSVRAI